MKHQLPFRFAKRVLWTIFCLAAMLLSLKPDISTTESRADLSTDFIWIEESMSTRNLAWGDWDNDGDLDLAVGNYDQVNQVYQNDGADFSLVWESTGDEKKTNSVAWGDWDNDSDLDLAVGNYDQVNQVYENDEHQTLRLDPDNDLGWESTGDEKGTRSVAWGDWDGDGDIDLAVGNSGNMFSSNVDNQVYRNDGENLILAWEGGGWKATQSVAWGDWDGDGDLDLAVGNWGSDSFPGANEVYRNDGGNLSLAWQTPEDENQYTRSVAWGDWDGDGDLDLAVGNSFGPNLNTSKFNQVYQNDGESLNLAWESADGASYTYSVAWGDCDGDGDLDLAIGNSGVNLVHPNGGGSLNLAWQSTGNNTELSVAWGDWDGDGDLDLVVGGYLGSQVYQNDDGTLSLAWSSSELDSTESVAWGDWDGDGDLDIAVGNYNNSDRVYANSNGNLVLAWTSPESDNTFSVAWGDWDGDGDLDLAAGTRVYENDGSTLVLDPENGFGWDGGGDGNSVAWGDWDSDGDLDLAVGNRPKQFGGLKVGGENQVYQNDEDSLSLTWESTDDKKDTESIAWGDWDGDGDLDLAVGNYGEVNQVYQNDGASLSLAWESTGDETETSSVAWGDWDGDGDLDLVISNPLWRTQIYQNPRRKSVPLVNNPPYVTISRPGGTNNADFFSSPEILQAANISIPYTLFDPEGDVVPKIFPEFSLNGGGQWFTATPGPGGDGLMNLAASQEGTPHTFIWNAESDLIKSNNVVFRIRAQPNYSYSPILWPATDGKSPSFRVEVPWFVKVVDDRSNPINGATIYANSQPIGVTNRAGLLNSGSIEVGTSLVVLAQQVEQSTVRDAHDGWGYRTYLTNLALDADSQVQPFIVSEPGEQRLVARNPLMLFNLVISIEWDAADAYLDEIASAVQSTSDYLYDLSDGQMVFGQVAIYDEGTNWADADIQISTKNIVRPHAYIGGITSDDKAHVIRVGRGWDGHSGNQGTWDEPDGFRTLVHEFGHYALYLYDEYFGYTFDLNGNLTGEVPTYCTGLENRNPATDATNASAMDYQYTSSELSARNVPGMWSNLCEETAQWQLTKQQLGYGESAWETVARQYGDTEIPPRWQLTTPVDRGGVLAGPAGLPVDVLALPAVTIHNRGRSEPPRQLTIYNQAGRPFWGAIVALYKADGQVIGQGFTDRYGRLTIYGAEEGDVLRIASFDAGLAGNIIVETEMDINLDLAPIGGFALQAETMTNGHPHMRVVAEPSQNPGQVDLLVFLHNLGPGADPGVIITTPGSETGFAPTLDYSSSKDTYEGQISFSATSHGMGRIRVTGAVGNSILRLQSTYRLQRVINDVGGDVFSDDGNLSLHLDPGSLPGNEAYLAVMPPGAVPGPLPTGLVLVGDAYDVTASGALVDLEKSGVLKLHYDGVLVTQSSAPEGLGLYRWDPNKNEWLAVSSSLDEEQKGVVAPVTVLGTYALMAPSWNHHVLFLPIALKNGP